VNGIIQTFEIQAVEVIEESETFPDPPHELKPVIEALWGAVYGDTYPGAIEWPILKNWIANAYLDSERDEIRRELHKKTREAEKHWRKVNDILGGGFGSLRYELGLRAEEAGIGWGNAERTLALLGELLAEDFSDPALASRHLYESRNRTGGVTLVARHALAALSRAGVYKGFRRDIVARALAWLLRDYADCPRPESIEQALRNADG
jgi:hypothetical protein